MRLGVIGYGNRIQHMVKIIRKEDMDFHLAAVTELEPDRFRNDPVVMEDHSKLYTDAATMLKEAKLDAVAIGTRCSLHTRLACQVLEAGLPLFLEKPVSTSYSDLLKLYKAEKTARSQVVVSFPLRGSQLVELAKEIVDSGRIGTVENVQAVNNVPYGGIYYQNWYRDENETQGLFLQKATHDFDYINYLAGQDPVAVCAMKSKQIFKGSHPAGLTCPSCTEKLTCIESSILKKAVGEFVPGESCCFAVDTGNEDSGSAIVRYASGMHVCYSQNFFARRGAQARGATLIGYKGTLQFDFYAGTLKVHMHHTPRVETYQLEQGEGHHGGDAALGRNFACMVAGLEDSKFTLTAGLKSALMCLKARQSALTDTFQRIELSEDGIHE
jgi:predicted dehydrogenase